MNFQSGSFFLAHPVDLGPDYKEPDPNGISGPDPLFEGRLHGIGSTTVGVCTGSDPFGFYELLASALAILFS